MGRSQTDVVRRTRQISWVDPLTTAAQAAELPGLEFLERIVRGEIPPPPIAEVFGAQLTSVADGRATFTCTPDEMAYNPIGTIHGGWLCTLLDSAAGCAVHTRLPAGAGYTSIEIKVSFIKAVHGRHGAVEVHGHALRVGRRIAFAEAHAYARDGELVGHATSSLALLGTAT